MYFKKLNRTDLNYLIILTLLWILMVVIVNPIGNFPLNDDWVYGKAVQTLLETGNFTLADAHSSANLIVQAFWGALFCLPFGFSFTALRFSTLPLGLVGILATYSLLRYLNASSYLSFLGALLIALNPIYFQLSNTFMTDIPYFALATLSVYFLVRGLAKQSKSSIFLGIILCYISLLIRQTAIFIILAFGCAYLVQKGLRKKNLIIATIPIILGIGIQLSYQSWLKFTDRISPAHSLQANNLRKIILSGNIELISSRLIENTLIALIYLGLFLSPIVIALFWKKITKLTTPKRRVAIFSSLSIFFLLGAWLLRMKGKPMPLSTNILLQFGVGPLTLYDTYTLKPNIPLTPFFLKIIWWILTLIALIGASLLIYYIFIALLNIFKNLPQNNSLGALNVFLLTNIALFYLPMGIQGYYDRYLLPLLPLLMGVFFLNTPTYRPSKVNFKRILAIAFICVFCGWFTLGSTHDYLSWNRIRWQALNDLTSKYSILPNYIDGGYEFNGWHLYKPIYKRQPQKSWWWVDKDDYIISFGSLSGYQEIRRYSFKKLLPFGPSNILILSKQKSS